MRHIIELPSSIIHEAFRIALLCNPVTRSDFFSDVRTAFKSQVESILNQHGIATYPGTALRNINYLRESRYVRGTSIIKFTGFNNDIREELDMEFCAKHGHDERSLTAINYLDRGYCELPSLMAFVKADNFSLGNILSLVLNEDYEIDISPGAGLRLTGYAHHISGRKKKSFLILFGIHFDVNLITDLFTERCTCANSSFDLDEVRIGHISYPFMLICRRCGNLFTCSCFERYFSIKDDIIRHLPYGNSEKYLRTRVENIQLKNGVCGLCTGKVPRLIYGSEMYYSSFLQKYLPYHRLFARKKYGRDVYETSEHKIIENDVRKLFNYPKIGEKWISETILFKVISTVFSPLEVIHHYRGKELQGLELDIWVPEYKLAIEYQGEQHYQAIEHWGGAEGLRKRQENDHKKKELCKQAGYTLIKFHHSQKLSEDTIRKKLANYIRDRNKAS